MLMYLNCSTIYIYVYVYVWTKQQKKPNQFEIIFKPFKTFWLELNNL